SSVVAASSRRRAVLVTGRFLLPSPGELPPPPSIGFRNWTNPFQCLEILSGYVLVFHYLRLEDPRGASLLVDDGASHISLILVITPLPFLNGRVVREQRNHRACSSALKGVVIPFGLKEDQLRLGVRVLKGDYTLGSEILRFYSGTGPRVLCSPPPSWAPFSAGAFFHCVCRPQLARGAWRIGAPTVHASSSLPSRANKQAVAHTRETVRERSHRRREGGEEGEGPMEYCYCRDFLFCELCGTQLLLSSPNFAQCPHCRFRRPARGKCQFTNFFYHDN
ncbi:hypothetical protein Taro_040147, partial [Colocasia esculenta]|nr:hypothetical protein [Colocasia esculenta]